jgi:hypothetical protein
MEGGSEEDHVYDDTNWEDEETLKPPEDNGFSGQPTLMKIDAAMATEEKLIADAFIDVEMMFEGEPYPQTSITVGEQFVPVHMRLSAKTGKMIFWFRLHDPDKADTEQNWKMLYGLVWVDVPDVFPGYAERIENTIGVNFDRFDKVQRSRIGSRRRIITTINKSLESRSLSAEFERERQASVLRGEFYKADNDTGMF